MVAYLQSYILPVVAFSIDGGSARIERFFGTAFVISSSGLRSSGSLLVSARHVVVRTFEYCKDRNLLAGVVGKANNGRSAGSVAAAINVAEAAPDDADIALIFSTYVSNTFFKLADEKATEWRDIATAGYPDEAVSGSLSELRINLRAQKGYVQRLLAEGDVWNEPRLSGYELSFGLAEGMSGAPIFQKNGNSDEVVGVAVATFGREVVLSETTLVDHDGKDYTEVRYGLNKHGVAADLVGLRSWKPDILFGPTLGGFLEGERAKAEQVFVAPGPLEVLNTNRN